MSDGSWQEAFKPPKFNRNLEVQREHLRDEHPVMFRAHERPL